MVSSLPVTDGQVRQARGVRSIQAAGLPPPLPAGLLMVTPSLARDFDVRRDALSLARLSWNWSFGADFCGMIPHRLLCCYSVVSDGLPDMLLIAVLGSLLMADSSVLLSAGIGASAEITPRSTTNPPGVTSMAVQSSRGWKLVSAGLGHASPQSSGRRATEVRAAVPVVISAGCSAGFPGGGRPVLGEVIPPAAQADLSPGFQGQAVLGQGSRAG